MSIPPDEKKRVREEIYFHSRLRERDRKNAG